MLSKPLIAFSTAYDFETEDEYAYGEIDGYMVSVFNTGTKKTAYISCCFEQSDANNTDNESVDEGENSIDSYALSNDIVKLIKDGNTALKDYEIGDSYVAFTTNEALSAFDKAVTAIIVLLKEYGARNGESCAFCGKCSTKLAVHKMKANYLCSECAADFESELEETKKVKTKTGKGTIFSILGAILGTLIIVASNIWIIPNDGIWDMHPLLLSLPLVVLLTVLSFLFYRIFTGRKGMERILPCLLTSVVFTAVSVYISTAIVYAKDMGVASLERAFDVSKIVLGSPISDPYYKSDFLTHLFYSMVVVIITVLVYSIIFEEKKAVPTKVFSIDGCDESCAQDSVEDEEDTDNNNE